MIETIGMITSLIIGTLSFGFAVFERNERKKITEYVRTHNWFNYQRIENNNGIIQLCGRLYLENHKDNPNLELLKWLSMADAHGQELYKEAIKQLQMSEPSFNIDDFNRWHTEGKITSEKIGLFKRFTTDPSSKTLFRKKSKISTLV